MTVSSNYKQIKKLIIDHLYNGFLCVIVVFAIKNMNFDGMKKDVYYDF